MIPYNSLMIFILSDYLNNSRVSVHMNPVATHEFSGDFARELKEYLDAVGWIK